MDLKKLSPTNPERYVAIAVEDLIHRSDREALHLSGEPTKEFLAMLCLYAIHRAEKIFDEGSFEAKMLKTAKEGFDPDNMSDEFVECLKELTREPL